MLNESMKAAVRHDRIGHAYIIDGAPGSDKSLLAAAFAGAILCESRVDEGSCGQCLSCFALQSDSHPDVVFVRSAKKTMGIDTVREQIIEGISILPYRSERRVYIIEDAATMTIPAQNALLKTLEDGPKYAVFFLLSENYEAFLPTVLSRCVLYKMTELSYAQLKKRSSPFCEEILDMVRGIESKNIVDVFACAKAMESHKERIKDALDILEIHFRDILIEQLPDSPHVVIRKIHAVHDARQKLNRNCNFLLTIEVMMLKLAAMA